MISIETDDPLGGGNGPQWDTVIDRLIKHFELCTWKWLQSIEAEYGRRTLHQLLDFGFEVSMGRYLWEKVKEIPLPRGRK